MLVVLRANQTTPMSRTYSRYVDHLESEGSWVLVTQLAQELGILDSVVRRNLYRLQEAGRVEIRKSDRGLQAKSTRVMVNI